MISRQDEIFLNQVAQGLLPFEAAVAWFESLLEAAQEEILRELIYLSSQAGARDEDIQESITQSRLRPTFTPCIVLRKDGVKHCRLDLLPPDEHLKSFRLLMALFEIADQRRRATSCKDGCKHWWHHLETSSTLRIPANAPDRSSQDE
ncbi:hypothetical protein J7643_06410 [bacterium]|nr:hypothetical protein [bacterium]